MDFSEKFIAFVDILGFESLVQSAESGDGKITLSKLLELTTKLGSPDDRKLFETHGPIVCPVSTYIRRDLDFQVTQITDCVIVSTEISPAGAINLIGHCWQAVMRLLDQGIMCRGYITRGKIYHAQGQFIGSGYQNAYHKEQTITAFKRDPQERSTPFVEVDPVVSEYVKNCDDKCVKEMFSRFVKTDEEVTALFPFKTIQHTFAIGGWGPEPDPEEQRKSNQNVRNWILNLKKQISVYVDPANPSAVKKSEHYVAALNEQLAVCDKLDRIIDSLPKTRGRPNKKAKTPPTDERVITKIKDLPDWPPAVWRSKDFKRLQQAIIPGCHLKHVILPLMKTNFVTLKIEHDSVLYSADLIVPVELKDVVGITLMFAMNNKDPTMAELGETNIL